jgi:Oxidoreductase family, NAD-binding Rossmann fold
MVHVPVFPVAGVDAVVIVTPNDTHARLLELAAHAGKAVFSEKPIAKANDVDTAVTALRFVNRRFDLRHCDQAALQAKQPLMHCVPARFFKVQPWQWSGRGF